MIMMTIAATFSVDPNFVMNLNLAGGVNLQMLATILRVMLPLFIVVATNLEAEQALIPCVVCLASC